MQPLAYLLPTSHHSQFTTRRSRPPCRLLRRRRARRARSRRLRRLQGLRPQASWLPPPSILLLVPAAHRSLPQQLLPIPCCEVSRALLYPSATRRAIHVRSLTYSHTLLTYYVRSLAAGARAELRGAAPRGAARVSVTCALPSAVDGTEFRARSGLQLYK